MKKYSTQYNLNNNLCTAIDLCNGNYNYFREFSRIYTFTTENISGYMNYFDFNNKSLLTVGSSGDQVLNSFMHGAKDITLFDINPYAKYYVYLKIASIVSLDYHEFINFFFKHTISSFEDNEKMFSKITFNKIKYNLRLFDYESYLFFDELFSLYDGKVIRSRLFDDDENRRDIIMGFNSYLKDEDSYNKLKNIIKKLKFKYVNGDIFKDDIEGKFDNIFLSNLCGLVNLDELKKLLTKLDKNNLNNNGSILLGYLWETDFDSNEYKDNWIDIYKLPIVKEKLSSFISEYHKINCYRDILFKEDKKRDLVLIYRK